MKTIGPKDMDFIIKYEGKTYILSPRKELKVGDMYFDRRDWQYKILETETDLRHMSFTAPESYDILDEI